jgi:hypothetical protein
VRIEPRLVGYELSAAVMLADETVGDRFADAPEPFWQHVREATLEHQREWEAWEAEA